MADKVEVQIDRDGCISCAACWTACPEVFQENPSDGLSEVVPQYRAGGDNSRGEAPGELADKVQEASDSCPTSVIHVK